MGKLVLSGIKGGLHVLVVEPVAPNSKRPVPGDGRMSFEGRVKSATGTIYGKKGEHRIFAARGRRRSLRIINIHKCSGWNILRFAHRLSDRY